MELFSEKNRGFFKKNRRIFLYVIVFLTIAIAFKFSFFFMKSTPLEQAPPLLQDSHFRAPCQPSKALEEKIYQSNLARDKRSWSDMVQRYSPDEKKFQETLKDLKELLALYYLLRHDTRGAAVIFGGSGTATLRDEIAICICEELSFLHQYVQGGIHEEIDIHHEGKIIITEAEKEAFKLIYRACRMMTCRSYRLDGLFTRSAYLPSLEEERKILSLLNINPEKDGVCVYELNAEKDPIFLYDPKKQEVPLGK